MNLKIVISLCIIGVTLGLPQKRETTEAKLSSEIKDWLRASLQISELVDTYSHAIDDLTHSELYHKDIAADNGNLLTELLTSSELWDELGDEGAPKITRLINKLYSQFDHTNDDRKKRETDEELEEMEEIESTLSETDDEDSKAKVKKIKGLLKNLEKGSGVMRKAVENEDVKKIYHYVCEAASALSKKPAKFSENDVMKSKKKSLKERICSEKTFDQVKNVLTKGHQFFAKANEVLHEEHLTTVVSVAKKFKNWFKKKV